MTSSLADLLDKQLDSYRAIARRRSRSGGRNQDGGHWMRFAAATGASLAGAATADAAINWVVPPSPIRVNVSSNTAKPIDLNNDAQFDLRVGAFVGSGPISTNFFSGTARGLYDAEIVGDHSFGNSQVAIRKFQNGEVIPAVQPSFAGSYLRTSITAFGSLHYGSNGNWGLNETGLAGIVTGINGQPRAGWIKIRTSGLGGRLRAVEVLEWAYETVAGVSIKAGQTISVGIPGDYNHSGTVGPEDYTIWKSTFGNNIAAGTGADGNSDGKINAADYTVWRNNLGRMGSGAAAVSIPEPSTVTLGVLALGAAGIAALRRKSQ